jgi:hypothetical protein
MLALIDTLRQIQGDSLEWLGLGPTEYRYRIVAAGARWQLRAYVDTSAGTPLLIVPGPPNRTAASSAPDSPLEGDGFELPVPLAPVSL